MGTVQPVLAWIKMDVKPLMMMMMMTFISVLTDLIMCVRAISLLFDAVL